MFNVESTKAVVLTPFNSFNSLTPFFKKNSLTPEKFAP